MKDLRFLISFPFAMFGAVFMTVANWIAGENTWMYKKRKVNNSTINLDQHISDLAQAMAYEACKGRDIKTTAEGRSALKNAYTIAMAHLEDAVDNYLDKV